MVGPLAAALCADLDGRQVVCWGVAAAVENLAHAQPGTVKRRRFDEILLDCRLHRRTTSALSPTLTAGEAESGFYGGREGLG
jgi:hypothetical protein